jgi:hypothetical protein
MKPSRFRKVVVATVVVCGSVLTGVGLGKFLTRVVLAADRPGRATVPSGRTTSAGPNLRSRGAGLRVQGRALNFGSPVIPGGLRIIQIQPQDLPPKPAFNPAAALAGPGGPGGGNPSKSLPLFTYQFTADPSLGGGSYSGVIMGNSPTSSAGKGATATIPVQIVPLIITINDSAGATTVTYDPTAIDSCATPGSHTQLELVQNSPLFQDNPWTMNGVNVGNTQYIDAFQRAQFASIMKGPDYHLLLSPTTLPAQRLTFSGTNVGIAAPGCGTLGVVNINQFDDAVHNLITGPLAKTVNPGTLPIFLMKNVVASTYQSSIDPCCCCILGYHGTFQSSDQIQVYSPFVFETTGAFTPTGMSLNSAVLSHELGEAVNDPHGINATPSWGNVGQVGACQNNFEVGDPLSGTLIPPVVGANGYSYNLQELAFIRWFFGGTAPLGAGGVCSSNGTFKGFAIECPPGGTN